jgi:hypothetical protein
MSLNGYDPFESLSLSSADLRSESGWNPAVVRDPFDNTSLRSSDFGSTYASDGTSSRQSPKDFDDFSVRSDDGSEPMARVDVRGKTKQLKDTPHNEYMRNYMRDYMKAKRERERSEKLIPKPQLVAFRFGANLDATVRKVEDVEIILANTFKNLIELMDKIMNLHVIPDIEGEQLAERLKHTDILDAMFEIIKFLNDRVIRK